ncbi:hypothetical protein KP509_26G008600 [Ceratopteris richardii]|uniref:Uncharacterized protein n=1 Tax=Ceratopteris richardii TaxID=49495 RepID=A0A8T2RK67_CERRI|nr:hypothetical protein KP509_26G008600 [Ceratopteris richardii]
MLFRLYEFIEPRDKYDRLHKCLSLSDLALAKVSLFLSFAERPTNVTIAAAMCAQIQALTGYSCSSVMMMMDMLLQLSLFCLLDYPLPSQWRTVLRLR